MAMAKAVQHPQTNRALNRRTEDAEEEEEEEEEEEVVVVKEAALAVEEVVEGKTGGVKKATRQDDDSPCDQALDRMEKRATSRQTPGQSHREESASPVIA